MVVVTRFAPSPTGKLHLGNLRTALFNRLFAKSAGGRFILRIEDTDQKRGEAGYEAGLLDDLCWLGLDWDEGPEREGAHAPYRQSQRGEIYRELFERLEAQELVYPCFCTPEELNRARAAMRTAGKPPRYPGTCADLTRAEREARRGEGRTANWRFRVRQRAVSFDDIVRGTQSVDTRTIGDFVIRRSDGSPVFFFANAVDDAHMGITHVLRGEDHLANTPRQLLILEALDMQPPLYGHLPLVLSSDAQKLSKRDGNAGLIRLREAGYLPLAIHNYLARLGHHYESDALLSDEELIAGFHPDRLGRAPAMYDASQLDYWQKSAVARMTTKTFADWMGKDARARVPAEKMDQFIEAVRPNCTFPLQAKIWTDILFDDADLSYIGQAADTIEGAEKTFFRKASEALERSNDEVVTTVKDATGMRGKALFMPLRAALTGHIAGPDLNAIIELLGRDEIVRRLKHAEKSL